MMVKYIAVEKFYRLISLNLCDSQIIFVDLFTNSYIKPPYVGNGIMNRDIYLYGMGHISILTISNSFRDLVSKVY
jgi:hypothetical protein